MDKYIFLKVAGSLIIGEEPKWGEEFNSDCVDILNTLIKETGAKIIIIDAPVNLSYMQTLTTFTTYGFQYPENIIGQLANEEYFRVSSPYDSLLLGKFPMTTGNNIKYWVDNFLVKPYNLKPKVSKHFEIWDTKLETPEYKGMRELVQGKDFKVLILTDNLDLLLEQKDDYIELNKKYGLNSGNIRSIINHF